MRLLIFLLAFSIIACNNAGKTGNTKKFPEATKVYKTEKRIHNLEFTVELKNTQLFLEKARRFIREWNDTWYVHFQKQAVETYQEAWPSYKNGLQLYVNKKNKKLMDDLFLKTDKLFAYHDSTITALNERVKNKENSAKILKELVWLYRDMTRMFDNAGFALELLYPRPY